MLVFTEKKVLSQHLSSIIEANKSIGFVPTMGALHQGHLSLMEQALKENDTVVVSIFVNPTQFNNIEDLEKYPRTLEADVNKMQTLSEKLLVYAPDVKDIYEEKSVKYFSQMNVNYDGGSWVSSGTFSMTKVKGDKLEKDNFSWFGKCIKITKKHFKKPEPNKIFYDKHK